MYGGVGGVRWCIDGVGGVRRCTLHSRRNSITLALTALGIIGPTRPGRRSIAVATELKKQSPSASIALALGGDGGVRWCAVVCGGVRWCTVVYGGVRWCKVPVASN